MFDGDPASPEAIDSILSAMQIGMELAKRRTKKNTHRKNIKRTDVYGHKKERIRSLTDSSHGILLKLSVD